MAGRRDATKSKPVVGAGAVAVHGTVHEHRWRALLVFRDNQLEKLRIVDLGEALIVKHNIVSL